MSISKQDVFDRADAAEDAYDAAFERWKNHGYDDARRHRLFEESRRLYRVSLSWRSVADSVRNGEDPLLAVMSRE